MRHKRLEPKFVEFVPEQLDPGTLYVSIEYATASHLCCCGCGTKVVTPLTPTDWALTFDGENVSLWPSVGNWEQACQSHYVLTTGRVVPYGRWTKAEIERSRTRDRAAKAVYYGAKMSPPKLPERDAQPSRDFWSRLRAWFRRRR